MSSATPAAIDQPRQRRAVAAHTRTQVLGLSLIGGAILFVVTAALLLFGAPAGEAAPLLVFAAVAFIGAGLARRFGTWGRVVGLLLGLGAAFVTFWMMFGVMLPSSFVEFTGGTAYVLGVLLMLYGGIASLVRRADLRTESARSEVLLERTALGIVALALVVSLPLWLTGRETVAAADAEGLPTATASNFAYEDVTVTSSDGTAIVVRNEDPFHHTFTIDELGIDIDLLPGSAQIVDLPATAGSWTYYCVPHSSPGGEGEDDMAATLTIE